LSSHKAGEDPRSKHYGRVTASNIMISLVALVISFLALKS